MTDESINRRIAEHLGWTPDTQGYLAVDGECSRT
jgi:hypothetical protein